MTMIMVILTLRAFHLGSSKEKSSNQMLLKSKEIEAKLHLCMEVTDKYDFESEKFYRPDGLSMLIRNTFDSYPTNKQSMSFHSPIG